MLSCPSDIPTQMISAVRDAINDFNDLYGDSLSVFLSFKNWSLDAYPQSGGTPQDLINSQLLEPSNLLLAIFWTRLGTETRDYDSGTVEEIERSLDNNRQVFLYICKADVPRDMLGASDTKAVDDYVHTNYGKRAIFGEFKDADELRKKVREHLLKHFLHLESHKRKDDSKSSKDDASRFWDAETLERLKGWLSQREAEAKNSYPVKPNNLGYLLIDIVPKSALGILALSRTG